MEILVWLASNWDTLLATGGAIAAPIGFVLKKIQRGQDEVSSLRHEVNAIKLKQEIMERDHGDLKAGIMERLQVIESDIKSLLRHSNR